VKNDPNYLGVRLFKTQDGFNCGDNTVSKVTSEIFFNDLIGQPTWLELFTVQMTVVMRADINVGSTVKIAEDTSFLNQAKKGLGEVKNKLAFIGTGQVLQCRHIGNYRYPDANSWVSVLNVFLNAK
jgi:hypothetical protein